MFVGWEGVGLCSYLLIGFWFRRNRPSDAGKKAFIVNRIGDFGFILGVLLAFVGVRHARLPGHRARRCGRSAPRRCSGPCRSITLAAVCRRDGKSAQIPLYVWLPDAMEGPTPVSALIHAATMVTAGVYMIGRERRAVRPCAGDAGGRGGGRRRRRRSLPARSAWSRTTSSACWRTRRCRSSVTCSWPWASAPMPRASSICYTHAFFKALLFLGSGAVIHALAGEQDLRRMGGLRKELPMTYWTFLIGALAIAGVPGLAGFFSKDEILYRTISGRTHALVGGRFADVAFDRHLHVPARLSGVSWSSNRGAPSRTWCTAVTMASARAHGAHCTMRRRRWRSHSSAGGRVVFAGYVGVPHALGGSNRIEQFLEPSFTAAEATTQTRQTSRSNQRRATERSARSWG